MGSTAGPLNTSESTSPQSQGKANWKLVYWRIPLHLKLLGTATLLSLLLGTSASSRTNQVSSAVVIVLYLAPLLLAAFFVVLARDIDLKRASGLIGPGVSAAGLCVSILLLLVLPSGNPRMDLVTLAAGISVLLFPTPILVRVSAVFTVLFLPAYFLMLPMPTWLWFSTGLLIAASARFPTDLSHFNLSRKLESTRLELAVKEKLKDGLKRTQQRLDVLIRNSRDIIIELNPRGEVVALNPIFEKVTGWPTSNWVGKSFVSLLHHADVEKYKEALHQAAETGKNSQLELRLRSHSGGTRLVDLTIANHAENDGLHQRGDTTLIVRDITDTRNTENALTKTQERFALAAQGANDGLWDWDLLRSQIYLSPRWKRMLGYEDPEIGTHPVEWFNRVHPDDLQGLRASLLRHMNGENPHFDATFRLKHKQGDYRWVSCRGLAVRDESGTATRLVGSQTDITPFKLTEKQLQHDAFHDPLTGLANRALFLNRLAAAIRRSKTQHDYSFAVLFLDLDRFKVINDSLGHEVGDRLLATAARRLKSCIRPTDTVARLGGDEFTILLDEVSDVSTANRVAEKIQSQLRTPFSLGGHEVYVTGSIGIAFSKSGYDHPSDLLRDADLAMYRAKILGKARHELFDHQLHAHAVALLKLENDLRRAVQRDEFIPFYQPIICLKTGTVRGFEALLRWKHPERGMLSPGEFLTIAEETGLIIPVGWRILKESCRQIKIWRDSFENASSPITISVNLSPRQLAQPEVVMQVTSALAEANLDPTALKIEITEGAIMEDSVIEPLKKLKELGVNLHLDDFGTGYSSLRYLNRFPLDVAKIDRSFIGAMTRDAESAKIVEAMVALSHTLGMEVVAEGVETPEQARQLRELECEYGQGFLYSAPVDSHSAENLMRSLLGPRSRNATAADNVHPFLRPPAPKSQASS